MLFFQICVKVTVLEILKVDLVVFYFFVFYYYYFLYSLVFLFLSLDFAEKYYIILYITW